MPLDHLNHRRRIRHRVENHSITIRIRNQIGVRRHVMPLFSKLPQPRHNRNFWIPMFFRNLDQRISMHTQNASQSPHRRFAQQPIASLN